MKRLRTTKDEERNVKAQLHSTQSGDDDLRQMAIRTEMEAAFEN